jgi:uncharacterized membrane protein YphA (DoxX/SURF4 family)
MQMSEPSVKTTFAPLILRLALAAIFIYHGLTKIIGDTDWGASWATHAWQQQGKLPKDVLAKLDNAVKAEKITAEKKADIEGELARAYTAAAKDVAPPPALQYAAAQLAVAWGEVLGGVAMLLGVLTRLAAVGLLVIQAGAIATVTWTQGFDVRGGGYEYNVALAAMCVALIFLGGGPLSVTELLRSKRRAARSVGEPAAAA